MSDVPYLTAELPGIGGTLKSVPEDFRVEEIPAYEPAGTGEFVFVRIEKRDLNTDDAVRMLARHCGVSPRDVGSAGLKDRFAVTRQTLSFPASCGERLAEWEHPQLQIIDMQQHSNKLRTGHLRGNRFSILVRGVADDAAERARAIRDRLLDVGLPNAFGEQRFGREGETAQTGFALLRGENPLRGLPPHRKKFLLRLSLSAAQSVLFNRCLAARLADGLLGTVFAGDVMQVRASGGLFRVEDPASEQARCAAGEIVVTGPIFGPKMKQPEGEPAERERRVLDEFRVADDDFLRYKKLTLGTRRPYVVRLDGLDIESTPEGLRFAFELPSGAYATVLLNEFMKPAADSGTQ